MVALIVACSENLVIGNNGRIPWKIKGEQKRFKELTTGNVVVMGRRSFEEIGKALPNRITVVVSSTKKFKGDNCFTVSSLKEALEMFKDKDVFISGGAKLYEEAIPIVDKMYITEISNIYEGDTYFPEFDKSKFERIVEATNMEGIPYSYVTYSRKKDV